jgi:aminoglycoside phosphotransferase (APT) family kinase protein
MSNPWEAEIEFSLDLARELVGTQFPELVPVQATFYGQGWDNLAVLVNNQWVFRFPQRELAREIMQGELACLLELPEDLPLDVPRPKYVGKPGTGYPYLFAGYQELPGKTSCSVTLSDAQRAACAGPLAYFLKELHDPKLAAVGHGKFHGDRIQRALMSRHLAPMEERLKGIRELPSDCTSSGLLSLGRDLLETPDWSHPPCLVHGDLYGRHLLVDGAGVLSGVIDWGDAHLGDPALDLSIVYAFFPPAARTAFFEVYGEIDGSTERRARYRALYHAVALVQYGEQVDDPAIAQVGRTALSFLQLS